jgi:hypothetical protein
MMIKVHIFDIYGKQFWRSSLYNWYPLHQNGKLFRDRGMLFKYFPKETDSIFDCDTLFIASSHYLWTHTSREKSLVFLEKARKKVKRIIWFDCEDSSGNTQFDVLPYVDRYLKKQLLKDRSLYSREFYFHNVASDFIHRHFAPTDTYWVNKPAYIPLQESEYYKVGISWNLGAYPVRCAGPMSLKYWMSVGGDFLERALGFKHYLDVEDPAKKRTIDLIGLFGVNYPSETIAYQRKYALKILQLYKRDTMIVGSEKIPRNLYWKYLRSAKIVLSLWGWGEVCVREMEGFVVGSAIVMPDMSHLDTWPSLYIPKETYYPVAWDLSNLTAVCNALLSDEKERMHIARMGQQRFWEVWSQRGKEQFVDRMAGEILGRSCAAQGDDNK